MLNIVNEIPRIFTGFPRKSSFSSLIGFPPAECTYSYLLKWRCSFHTSADRRLRQNRSIKCERIGERERIRRLYLWKLFFSLLRLLLIRIWWAFPNLRKRSQSYWTSRCSVRFMPVKWQWDEVERVAMKPKEWISEIWSFATQQGSPSIMRECGAVAHERVAKKNIIFLHQIPSLEMWNSSGMSVESKYGELWYSFGYFSVDQRRVHFNRIDSQRETLTNASFDWARSREWTICQSTFIHRLTRW